MTIGRSVLVLIFLLLNFLFLDDDLVPQVPPGALGKNFGNFWIAMRTGFSRDGPGGVSDSNEVALIFDAYGKTPIHMHQSRNNFVVGSVGEWLINEDCGFKTKYQSLYHNTIVVDSIWNNGDANYGQRGNSCGEFIGFYKDDNYCYCANGVAENCYARMKKFIRKIVFNKDGYIVMKDEVESSNSSQPRTYLWLLHIQPDHIYGDSLVEKTNKFYIKFLSPDEKEIHSWLAGPPGAQSSGVYVNNSTPAVRTEFLSAIITKRADYPWPPSIRKIDGTTMLGVEVNNTTIILYGKGQAGNISGVTYQIGHSFRLLKNILADLKSNHQYYVYLNNQYVASFISTNCGTGYFVIGSPQTENVVTVTDIPY